MERYWRDVIVGFSVWIVILIFIRVVMRGIIYIYREYNQTKLIEQLPDCVTNGEISLRIEASHGAYPIISLKSTSLEETEPAAHRPTPAAAIDKNVAIEEENKEVRRTSNGTLYPKTLRENHPNPMSSLSRRMQKAITSALRLIT